MPRLDRRTVALAEGAYYLATGVAPFVSRRLFEAVTGPKLEWWLVETVGATVTVAGGVMIAAAVNDRVTPEVAALGAGCAIGLGAIDVVYASKRRIAPTYLIDAAAQAAILGAWAAARRR